MKKIILIILKWLFWFSTFVFVSFLTLFFLSYLNKFEGLKTIPKNFFDTKYANQDFNSENNAFSGYVDIITNIDNNKDNISYFIRKDCIKFDKEKSCPKIKEKDSKKILENKIKEYSRFIFLNKKSFLKMYKKDFLYQKPKTSDINQKQLLSGNLLKYIKTLKYISTYYIENNNTNFGLRILLDHQTFIDFLINNSDMDLIQNLVILGMTKTNLETINYIIENYSLTKINKIKIKKVLNKEINYNLIENGIKREYMFFYNILNNDIKNNIFYSKEESISLKQAFFYEVIKNKGKSDNYQNINTLLYNYIGRKSHNASATDYSDLYKKEEYIKRLREDILEKLN